MQNVDAPDHLVFKPSLLARVAMWGVTGGGLLLLLGAWAAAEDEGLSSGIFVAVCASVFVAIGLSHALSRVTVDSRGVTYWNGVRRHVPASMITGVRVAQGNGAYYPRLTIWIDRVDARPLRLTAIQRSESEHGERALEQSAQSIAAEVGLDK